MSLRTDLRSYLRDNWQASVRHHSSSDESCPGAERQQRLTVSFVSQLTIADSFLAPRPHHQRTQGQEWMGCRPHRGPRPRPGGLGSCRRSYCRAKQSHFSISLLSVSHHKLEHQRYKKKVQTFASVSKTFTPAATDGAAPFIFSVSGPIQSGEVINQLKAVLLHSYWIWNPSRQRNTGWSLKHKQNKSFRRMQTLRVKDKNAEYESRKTEYELEALSLNLSLKWIKLWPRHRAVTWVEDSSVNNKSCKYAPHQLSQQWYHAPDFNSPQWNEISFAVVLLYCFSSVIYHF